MNYRNKLAQRMYETLKERELRETFEHYQDTLDSRENLEALVSLIALKKWSFK